MTWHVSIPLRYADNTSRNFRTLWRTPVSIPLRYADNSPVRLLPSCVTQVSIPLRYADNKEETEEAVLREMFQFLLGTLITVTPGSIDSTISQFQFLLGTLITKEKK